MIILILGALFEYWSSSCPASSMQMVARAGKKSVEIYPVKMIEWSWAVYAICTVDINCSISLELFQFAIIFVHYISFIPAPLWRVQ